MQNTPPQSPPQEHLSAAAERGPAGHGRGMQANGFRVTFVTKHLFRSMCLLLLSVVLQGTLTASKQQVSKWQLFIKHLLKALFEGITLLLL